MKIRCLYDELVPIQELHLNPDNRNVHPKDQIKRLAEILEYQGWRYPVKVSKQTGMVTSGHGRVEAAVLNEWREVPVNFQDYDTPEQEYADTIADNAIASWAELNLSGINQDIQVHGPELNIDMLGIRDFTVEAAEKLEPGCDEDEVPDQIVEPKTKLGDIYQLGVHRLMCGDSTSIDAVEKLMNGEKADMVFTDPPYDFETEGGGILGASKKMKDIKALGIDKFDPSVLIFDLAPTHVYYCNRLLIPNYIQLANDWDVSWDLCVSHKTFAPANWGGHLQTDLEYIMVLGRQAPNKGLDAHYYSKLWSGKKNEDDKESVGWAKPVAMCEKFILLYSNNTVLDLFGGSGSTLIACEKTNRRCFMMELDPHYCDVIVARWEKYTGKKAVLLTDPAATDGVNTRGEQEASA